MGHVLGGLWGSGEVGDNVVSWEEHQINMNPKPNLVSLFGDLGQVFWLNVPSSSGEKTSALRAAERIR